MRLLYLDEAGTDYRAPDLCVAGVLIHGDLQWPEVEKRFSSLVEMCVEPEEREGFIFHATDIYHGSGYFDRKKIKWANPEDRYGIIDNISKIIEDLNIPIVYGINNKSNMEFENDKIRENIREKHNTIHNVALMKCCLMADRWLARFAPNEFATVIHEDGTPAKPLIKRGIKILRSESLCIKHGLQPAMGDHALPLKRIIDTVHFSEKSGATPLQLADLCAFIITRTMKQAHVPLRSANIISEHLSWVIREIEQMRQPAS